MSLAELEHWVSGDQFAGDVVQVARDLIGRTLRVLADGAEQRGIIVETEAYAGPEDPASHAAFRRGGRAALMSGEPGLIYIYAAYGMYPCLNVVSGCSGSAAAVLLRGVWVEGDPRPTLGPGRTTRRLGVGMHDHGRRIGDGRFDISKVRIPLQIQQSTRIGITRGTELPWRFLADPHWTGANT